MLKDPSLYDLSPNGIQMALVQPEGRRSTSYSALNLDGNEIRLIEFHPTDNPDGPLECSVKTYSKLARNDSHKVLASGESQSTVRHLTAWRASSHPYRWGNWLAMSHCWGDQAATETILVNGENLKISTNMAAGLRSISQLPAVRDGELKVWNDFLCLDQHNKDEIERELKRVPSIYANAYAVISWIGPVADESSLVMTLLSTKLSALDHNQGTDALLKTITRNEWRALTSFLQRPYWRRTWIIQELTLAGNRTTLLCGNETAPLLRLWELVKAMIRNAGICHRLLADALGTGDTYYDPVRHATFSVIARLLYLHDIDHMRRNISHESEYDLLPLLDVCRASQQQYLRDKCYGVLGLLPSRVTRLIQPDLNKAPHAIYTDMVLASIQALQRLDVLQNCMFDATNPTFPTWTPDLRIKSMSHAIGSRLIMNSGGDLQHQPYTSPDRRTLTCRGFIADTVDHLTPPQWPLQPVTEQETSDAQPPSRHFPPPQQQPHTSVAESLFKALVGGTAGFPHDRPPPAEYSQLLDLPWPVRYDTMEPVSLAEDLINQGWCTPDEKQDLITFSIFRQRAGRQFNVLGRPLESFFPTRAHTQPTESATAVVDDLGGPAISTTTTKWQNRKMLRQACNTLKKRRLFITEQGRIGVCGRQARPRDLIAILQGCSTPLVLRRWVPTGANSAKVSDDETREACVVIGACYTDGLMSAEWLHNHSSEERDILLV